MFRGGCGCSNWVTWIFSIAGNVEIIEKQRFQVLSVFRIKSWVFSWIRSVVRFIKRCMSSRTRLIELAVPRMWSFLSCIKVELVGVTGKSDCFVIGRVVIEASMKEMMVSNVRSSRLSNFPKSQRNWKHHGFGSATGRDYDSWKE